MTSSGFQNIQVFSVSQDDTLWTAECTWDLLPQLMDDPRLFVTQTLDQLSGQTLGLNLGDEELHPDVPILFTYPDNLNIDATDARMIVEGIICSNVLTVRGSVLSEGIARTFLPLLQDNGSRRGARTEGFLPEDVVSPTKSELQITLLPALKAAYAHYQVGDRQAVIDHFQQLLRMPNTYINNIGAEREFVSYVVKGTERGGEPILQNQDNNPFFASDLLRLEPNSTTFSPIEAQTLSSLRGFYQRPADAEAKNGGEQVTYCLTFVCMIENDEPPYRLRVTDMLNKTYPTCPRPIPPSTLASSREK